ncbi:MAG: hypothetical protein AAB421_00045 [Patescibacteria group bacterium]
MSEGVPRRPTKETAKETAGAPRPATASEALRVILAVVAGGGASFAAQKLHEFDTKPAIVEPAGRTESMSIKKVPTTDYRFSGEISDGSGKRLPPVPGVVIDSPTLKAAHSIAPRTNVYDDHAEKVPAFLTHFERALAQAGMTDFSQTTEDAKLLAKLFFAAMIEKGDDVTDPEAVARAVLDDEVISMAHSIGAWESAVRKDLPQEQVIKSLEVAEAEYRATLAQRNRDA